MVDPDVLLRKAAHVEHHVARLRKRRPLDAQTLQADEDLRNTVLMDLLQAIQPCIDLAMHMCAHEALGVVDGPARAFAVLAREGIMPTDLSVRLTGAAGLRNLVVHQHGDLLTDRVAAALHLDLGDLTLFVRCLRDHARG